ncbi:hypothetical protein D3C78_505710 [compost metagenome]
MLPGSAVPVTLVPSPETTGLSGANGLVVSGASACPGRLVLLDGSVATTCKTSPFVCGGLMGTVNFPSLPAGPSPITSPLGAFIVTVLFGSAVPETLFPPLFTTRSPGIAGAVLSVAMAVAGGLLLPASSVATAEIVWPPI